MGKQDIVDRIISDAEAEAEAIISAAREEAAHIIAEATDRAENDMKELCQAVDAKVKSISDGKAATARLDGAKILLGEKRKVIDEVYVRALKQLSAMGARDYLAFTQKLLVKYAEDGDEIIFSDGFPCAEEVSKLDVVKDRKLKITFGKTNVSGGFVLCGKNSDKDLSFAALLAADRAEHEAEIAAELFK